MYFKEKNIEKNDGLKNSQSVFQTFVLYHSMSQKKKILFNTWKKSKGLKI